MLEEVLIMKKTLRGASLALFVLLGCFLVWFGWLYASVDKLLWFHAAALPEDARRAVEPLYFALMNLIGGASIGLGLLCLFVTATSVRNGSIAAATAVFVSISIPLVMAAVTAEMLARTGAPTSWRIMGGLLFVAALAYGFHIIAYRSKISLRRRAEANLEFPEMRDAPIE
ncbi:MAG: hypothetical protein AB7F91_02015 [Parvularculaceae bacterium]